MSNDPKINNYRFIFLVFLGIIFGIIYLLSPGGLCVALFVTICMIGCYKKYEKSEEAKFLLILFVVGFFSRIFVTVFSDLYLFLTNRLYQHAGYEVVGLWGDSNLYTIRSWCMLVYRNNPKEFFKYFTMSYGHTGYLYVLELFHFLFGFSPTSSKFINCFLGSFNGIIAYAITKNIFSKRAARVCAMLVTFFPSLFLWSVSNLKDIPFLTLTLGSFYIFMRYLKKRNFFYLLFLGVLLFLQLHIRANISRPLIIVMIIGLGLSLLNSNLKRIAFLTVISPFLWCNVSKFYQFKMKALDLIKYILQKHIAVTLSGGICYYILPATYYQSRDLSKLSLIEIFIAFLKGWFYFLFSPFPWRIQSISQFFSMPQMLLWYFSLIFAGIGFLIVFKKSLFITFLFALYIFLIGTLAGMSEGNIGTLFRHRDMITPLILIFGSITIAELFKKQQKV